MRTRTLIALAALPLLVAACGSDNKQSRSDVIKHANAICRQAGAEAQDYTRDRSGPVGQEQVHAALQKDVDIADAAVKKLEGIHPADEQKADFERFVTGLRGLADGDRRFIKAIKENDKAGVKEASAAAVNAEGKAKKGADAYGLDDCPYQPVSVRFLQKGKEAREQAAASRDPVGSWSGTVTQYGPGAKRSRYRAVMTVRDVSVAGSPAGSIEYPSFPCAGDLQLVRSRGKRYLFRERITSNAKKCTSGGQITSTVAGDRMGWRWIRQGVEVLGTLKRR